MVGALLVDEGTDVTPSTPILTFGRTDVQVDATDAQTAVAQLSVGAPVQVRAPAYQGVVFPAHVSVIGPVANSTSHTFDVRVLPDVQDPRLLPGMFAQMGVGSGT